MTAPRDVFVDTTELHDRHLLDTADWRELLERGRRGQVTIFMPVVVLDEAERQYAEAVDDAVATEENLGRRLARLGFEHDPRRLVDQHEWLVSRYRSTVERTLAEAHGVLLPLPSATHRDLLDRVTARMKPFNEKGRGYQDTLIWLTILEHLSTFQYYEQRRPVLVTRNTRDFGNGEGGLSDELSYEIDDLRRGLRLELMGSIRDVVQVLRDEFADEDRVQRLDTLRPAAAANPSNEKGTDTAAELERMIEESVTRAAYQLVGQRFDGWAGAADFEGLSDNTVMSEDLRDATVEDVTVAPRSLDLQTHDQFAGGTLALTATVDASVSLEGFIERPAPFMIDSSELTVLDLDWKEQVARVSVPCAARLAFNVLVTGTLIDDIAFGGAEPI